MIKNIFTSNTAKQLLGAGAGMALAGILYIAVEQSGNFSLQGLLIQPGVISDRSGEVSINNTDVDDGTLRRIKSRADAVARELQAATNEPAPKTETPMTERVDARRASRQFVHQIKADFVNAPTYEMDPNGTVVTEEQRLAIRAARIAGLPTPADTPSAVTPLTFDNPPETELVPTSENMHSGGPEMQPATSLPNSGFGLNLLVLCTLTLTTLSSTKLRRTLTFGLSRVRLG